MKLSKDFTPIGLYRSKTKPKLAKEFKSGKWNCVMSLIGQALLGKTVCFDKSTIGCLMGKRSLGYGNPFKSLPFPQEAMHYFLSTGNKSWEEGKKLAKKINWAEKLGFCPKNFTKEFLEGEGFKANPKLAAEFMDQLPEHSFSGYLIAQPLEIIPKDVTPDLVLLYGSLFEIHTVTSLLQYSQGQVTPIHYYPSSSCQSAVLLPYEYLQKGKEEAIMMSLDLQALSRMSNKFTLEHTGICLPYSPL
jgi:hypothetical protein